MALDPDGKSALRTRKSLRRSAEEKYGRPTIWYGGILYFDGTKDPVPDVPHVPKLGMPVVGIEGAQPAPQPKVERWRRSRNRSHGRHGVDSDGIRRSRSMHIDLFTGERITYITG